MLRLWLLTDATNVTHCRTHCTADGDKRDATVLPDTAYGVNAPSCIGVHTGLSRLVTSAKVTARLLDSFPCR